VAAVVGVGGRAGLRAEHEHDVWVRFELEAASNAHPPRPAAPEGRGLERAVEEQAHISRKLRDAARLGPVPRRELDEPGGRRDLGPRDERSRTVAEARAHALAGRCARAPALVGGTVDGSAFEGGPRAPAGQLAAMRAGQGLGGLAGEPVEEAAGGLHDGIADKVDGIDDLARDGGWAAAERHDGARLPSDACHFGQNVILEATSGHQPIVGLAERAECKLRGRNGWVVYNFLMVRPSAADKGLAELAAAKGAGVRGRPPTAVQIASWRERGAIENGPLRHPGRPSGGSAASYSDGAVDVVVGFAAALDTKPDSFDRAVLVAFARGVGVADRAIRGAYNTAYRDVGRFIVRIRDENIRIRAPKGIASDRMDTSAKSTLVELALDNAQLSFATDGVDALIRYLGLPDELTSAPPDPEVSDFPSFVEIIGTVALKGVNDMARTASRDDLAWAGNRTRAICIYAATLAYYVDQTRSSTTEILRPNEAHADSANHGYRTLVAAGRVLGRLLERGGPGSADYLGALHAPLVLAMLRILPDRARGYLDAIGDNIETELPRLLAMASLVASVDDELRYLLGHDGVERMRAASGPQRSALRTSVKHWLEAHPEQRAILAAPPPPHPGP